MPNVTVQVGNSLDKTGDSRSLYRGSAQTLTIKMKCDSTLPFPAAKSPSEVKPAAFEVSGLLGTLTVAGPAGWTVSQSTPSDPWHIFAPPEVLTWDEEIVLTLALSAPEIPATQEVELSTLYWLDGDMVDAGPMIRIVDDLPETLIALTDQMHINLLTPAVFALADAAYFNKILIVLSNSTDDPLCAASGAEEPVFTIELPLAETGLGALSTHEDAKRITGFVSLDAGEGYVWTCAPVAPTLSTSGTRASLEFSAPPGVLPGKGRVELGLTSIVSNLPLPLDSDTDEVVVTIRWRNLPGFFDGEKIVLVARQRATPYLYAVCEPDHITGSSEVTLRWQSFGLDSLQLVTEKGLTYNDISYDANTPIEIDPLSLTYGTLSSQLDWIAGDIPTISFRFTSTVAGSTMPPWITPTLDLYKPLPIITALTIYPSPASTGEQITISYCRNNATFETAIQVLDAAGEPQDCIAVNDPTPTDLFSSSSRDAGATATLSTPQHDPTRQTATCTFAATGHYRLLASADINTAKTLLEPTAEQAAIQKFSLTSISDYLPGTSFISDDDSSFRLDFIDSVNLLVSGVRVQNIDNFKGVGTYGANFTYKVIGRQIMLCVGSALIKVLTVEAGTETISSSTGRLMLTHQIENNAEFTGGFWLLSLSDTMLNWWYENNEPARSETFIAAIIDYQKQIDIQFDTPQKSMFYLYPKLPDVLQEWLNSTYGNNDIRSYSLPSLTQIDRIASLIDRDFILASNIDFDPCYNSPACPPWLNQNPFGLIGVISRCREIIRFSRDGSFTYRVESDDVVGTVALLQSKFAGEVVVASGPSFALHGSWKLDGQMALWLEYCELPNDSVPPSFNQNIGPRSLTIIGNALRMNDDSAALPQIARVVTVNSSSLVVPANRRTRFFLDGNTVGRTWQWPLPPPFLIVTGANSYAGGLPRMVWV